MARKYPKSLAEAIKVIKQWEHDHCMLNNRCVELQREVADWKGAAENRLKAMADATRDRDERGKEVLAREQETRKQMEDLKVRVHDLEIENAQMTGYLNRVQEDDEVREELVQVGDPQGEQTLVPKRKPHLNRMYSSGPPSTPYEQSEPFSYNNDYGRPKTKPKHWVNY